MQRQTFLNRAEREFVPASAIDLVERIDSLPGSGLTWVGGNIAAVWGVPKRTFGRWLGPGYRSMKVDGGRLYFVQVAIPRRSFEDAVFARFEIKPAAA